jgi:hypothetical protein
VAIPREARLAKVGACMALTLSIGLVIRVIAIDNPEALVIVAPAFLWALPAGNRTPQVPRTTPNAGRTKGRARRSDSRVSRGGLMRIVEPFRDIATIPARRAISRYPLDLASSPSTP